jgi:hypothetical protein
MLPTTDIHLLYWRVRIYSLLFCFLFNIVSDTSESIPVIPLGTSLVLVGSLNRPLRYTISLPDNLLKNLIHNNNMNRCILSHDKTYTSSQPRFQFRILSSDRLHLNQYTTNQLSYILQHLLVRDRALHHCLNLEDAGCNWIHDVFEHFG